MDTATISRRLRETCDAMGLDDEFLTFVLYEAAGTGCVEGLDERSFSAVMMNLKSYASWEGAGPEDIKFHVRNTAIDVIEATVLSKGLPRRKADELSRYFFRVDSHKWLPLDDLGAIICYLRHGRWGH